MNQNSLALNEFFAVAQALMRTGGDCKAMQNLAADRATLPNVATIIGKAAVAPGGLADPAWAGNLAPYSWGVDAFLEALRSASVFDRLLAGGARRIPLRTRIAISTTALRGSIVAGGSAKPVTKLNLDAQQLEPIKAVALVVITEELVANGANGSLGLLGDEMKSGVAASTDNAFLVGISTGAPTNASSGSTPANVLADVEWLLDQVAVAATSRLYLVVDPKTANKLATKASSDGSNAFPGMTPAGGELCGIPVLVTDEADVDSNGGSMTLIDATAIIANTDTVTLRTSAEASLQMTDVASDGATTMVSMFQTDSRAILAERWFGFELARADGVAVVTGVSY